MSIHNTAPTVQRKESCCVRNGFSGSRSSRSRASPCWRSPRRSAAPKAGGTIVVEMTSDVDYIDPQLSYYGETWKLEAITACKLFNWPDKEGAAGAVATPEVAAGLPVISKDGKTYTFTIKSGFKFSNGKAVNGEELRRRVQPFREPEDAVDRRCVPRRRQGRAGRHRRQGGHDLGRQGERQQAHRPADEARAGLHRPD